MCETPHYYRGYQHPSQQATLSAVLGDERHLDNNALDVTFPSRDQSTLIKVHGRQLEENRDLFV